MNLEKIKEAIKTLFMITLFIVFILLLWIFKITLFIISFSFGIIFLIGYFIFLVFEKNKKD